MVGSYFLLPLNWWSTIDSWLLQDWSIQTARPQYAVWILFTEIDLQVLPHCLQFSVSCNISLAGSFFSLLLFLVHILLQCLFSTVIFHFHHTPSLHYFSVAVIIVKVWVIRSTVVALLDCRWTERRIDPALGAWLIRKLISLAQVAHYCPEHHYLLFISL